MRGRPFQHGNRGRPRGSRNHATILADVLREGEAEGLIRKGVELAMGGDVRMLRFFLDRLLPRDRSTKLDLPVMKTADDAVDVLGQVIKEVTEGCLTPSEGTQLAAIINSYRQTLDKAEIEKGLEDVEVELARVGRRP